MSGGGGQGMGSKSWRCRRQFGKKKKEEMNAKVIASHVGLDRIDEACEHYKKIQPFERSHKIWYTHVSMLRANTS